MPRETLTQKDKETILSEFVDNLTSPSILAECFHVSRQSIYKLLKRNGIDTTKRKHQTTCTYCGAVIIRPKCQIRNRKNHFCSIDHFYAHVSGILPGEYVPHRIGQRSAREAVSSIFDLQSDHVVHHEDKNCFNNDLSNLKVFASQSDHIKYHRGIKVPPLWPPTASSPASTSQGQ